MILEAPYLRLIVAFLAIKVEPVAFPTGSHEGLALFLGFTGSVASLVGLLQLFHSGTQYNLWLVGCWGPLEGFSKGLLASSWCWLTVVSLAEQ
jgi:hypothetical protein